MQFETYPNLTIAVLAGLGLLSVGINFLRGNLYDIRSVKDQRRHQAHPKAKEFRKRRTISVIVVAGNNAEMLVRCLDSISQSSYRKYDIAVINQAKKDVLRSPVKAWQKAHAKIKLQYSSSKQKLAYEELLLKALRKTKGEIVVMLEAEQVIDKQLLSDVNTQFALTDAAGLEFSNRVVAGASLLNLLQRFEYVVSHRWHKGRGWIHKESKSVLRRPGAYQRAGLEAALREDKPLRLHYCESLAVYTPASPSYFRMVRRHNQERSDIWQLARDFTALAVSYLLYLAIYLKTPAWYGTMWISVTLLLVFIIATSKYISIGHRLRLILLSPLASLLFYVMSVIEAITFIIGSVIRTVFWPFRQVTRLF